MAAIEQHVIGQHPLASTYSVEVSGWDHSHTFFVERSELTWTKETGKLLTHTGGAPGWSSEDCRTLPKTAETPKARK